MLKISRLVKKDEEEIVEVENEKLVKIETVYTSISSNSSIEPLKRKRDSVQRVWYIFIISRNLFKN